MLSYVYGCGPCCEWNSRHSSLLGPHGRGYGPRLTEIFHSSKLDGKDAKGKRAIIIDGGASAVEAMRWAVNIKADHISVLARPQK
jgi:cation diffusion facilitator CzcD-associated flavoprotein CzcO